MDLPNLAKLWPVGLAGRPDLLPPPNNGDNPREDDDDWDQEEQKQNKNSSWPFQRQPHRENERSQEEDELRNGAPTTRVLSELGVTWWEICVDEDRDPDGDGEEHHRSSSVLLFSEHCFETVGAPEGSE